MTKEQMLMRSRKLDTWVTVVQSVLILVMLVLVAGMMYQISCLQGTARVINYAGLVRGATQREIKLEIADCGKDELITYLDEILDGLKHGSGKYELVSLEDEAYQSDLSAQMAYWKVLKGEIYKARDVGYEKSDIVEVSERYFHMADETVSAAERYSESIATDIRRLEIATAIDMAILVLMILVRSLEAIRMRRKNRQLEQRAYIDQHTGLPNKGRCEEFFYDAELMRRSIACIVFDLNNLKFANDTLGHSVGDQLIANFARLLRNAVPARHFVGRYGGDEFMTVLYDVSAPEEVEAILGGLKTSVDEFNRVNHGGSAVEVSYACGWVLSSQYPNCSFRVLFDLADKSMYENKKRSREKIG